MCRKKGGGGGSLRTRRQSGFSFLRALGFSCAWSLCVLIILTSKFTPGFYANIRNIVINLIYLIFLKHLITDTLEILTIYSLTIFIVLFYAILSNEY